LLRLLVHLRSPPSSPRRCERHVVHRCTPGCTQVDGLPTGDDGRTKPPGSSLRRAAATAVAAAKGLAVLTVTPRSDLLIGRPDPLLSEATSNGLAPLRARGSVRAARSFPRRGRMLRPLVPVLIALACVAAAGCKVTREDIDYWTGTQKGPGKIVAVLLADKYEDDLRAYAGLALVR